MFDNPIEYDSQQYPSPCGKERIAHVVQTTDWDSVYTYKCGCKVYENEYGGREARCNGKA